MSSFDVSAIDVVLVVAVFILLLLQVTRKTDIRTNVKKTRISQKNSKVTTEVQKPSEQIEHQTDLHNCIHNLGYLKSLPPNAAIPNECFGCRKVMQCLSPNK